MFAKIEGLDKVEQLAVPKPSRVLVEERVYVSAPGEISSSSPPVAAGKAVKGKTSLKRLSDALTPSRAKKCLWLVVFNDVVLKYQTTRMTSLPLEARTARATQGRTRWRISEVCE